MDKRERLLELIRKNTAAKEVKLSSGRPSNYYIDCRMVTLNPEGAALVAEILFDILKDEDIDAPIIDYANDYPVCKSTYLGTKNYKELKSGKIIISGKEVPTASLSSYSKAVEIANILKEWIKSGQFLLTEPVAKLPNVESGYTFKILKERPIE